MVQEKHGRSVLYISLELVRHLTSVSLYVKHIAVEILSPFQAYSYFNFAHSNTI